MLLSKLVVQICKFLRIWVILLANKKSAFYSRTVFNSYIFFLQNTHAVRKIRYLIEEIKIQYCYPRLDVNVTKGFNHLLKSPFSIHPKTGNVSIVFKPADVKNLKLNEIPSLNILLDDSSPDNALHVANMKRAVKNFQEVVFSLEKAEAMRRRNDPSKYIQTY